MMRPTLLRWLRSESGPLLALVLVLGGALIAVDQHGQLRLERQRAETARYLAEFDHGPVAVAWRCLRETWRAQGARQEALLACVAADPPAATLHDHRRLVLDTVDEHRLDEAVTTVFRYFSRLALCIRVGGCDGATAVDALGESAWHFRNQHYLFLTEHLAAQEVDQVFEILAHRPPGGGGEQVARPRGGDDGGGRQSAQAP